MSLSRIARSGFGSVTTAGSAGAGAWPIEVRVSRIAGCANGFVPVSASQSVTPSEKRSLRASTRAESTCSGDMYAGVPATDERRVAARVAAASSVWPGAGCGRSTATPKSSTLT